MTVGWRKQEHGAAALIVVVFSVLLLVTVSVGFMRLVVQDQKRTNADELSRGAYDSAVAGVEDGKRVLQACIAHGDARACDAINDNACNTVQASRILSASEIPGEVEIRSSSGGDGGYSQAYTCVKIQRNTDDYEAPLTQDISQVLPLQTTAPFTDIILSWFLNPGPSVSVNLGAGDTLPAMTAWSPTGTVRPPMIRAQLIQFNRDSFELGDFDQNGSGHTLYLYPSMAGADTDIALDFGTDNRRNASTDGLLKPVRCTTAITARYLCSVRLSLPLPAGGSSTTANRQAYLRLTSLYGDTTVSVAPVAAQLQDVLPAIDSTGRAADVFRRIRARVQLVSPLENQLTPRATVDITKNFCKNISVSTIAPPIINCQYTQPAG